MSPPPPSVSSAAAEQLTSDRYLDLLVRFVSRSADSLLDGTVALRITPMHLGYAGARLGALADIEARFVAGAPVDYLRAYVADLGDHRALERLRRILQLLPELRVVAGSRIRDRTPLALWPFKKLRVLELRGCDLSSAEARGLLDLRGTLEKIICHNSTDALRHVFTSRIVDIKESASWERLSYVSCACNGLILMDESLQLLPSVETLDLSRNKFAKVDNLHLCRKLQFLDLGFNQFRSIAKLSEVSPCLVKLVLRNNALSSLRGIENLKSLIGLDLSYNIISNFSELEILRNLTCLESLWMEGNPVCWSRWYRARVFSFFSNAARLKLDDKSITTQEYWEMHVIFSRRKKQPAGFGFYFPAKDDPEDESWVTSKKKRSSRIVLLDEGRHQLIKATTEQGAMPIDSNHSKKEKSIDEHQFVIETMKKRAEQMKREKSDLWLQEFKEWMEDNSDDTSSRESKSTYNDGRFEEQNNHQMLSGESSKVVPDVVESSESGTHDEMLTDFVGNTVPKYSKAKTSALVHFQHTPLENTSTVPLAHVDVVGTNGSKGAAGLGHSTAGPRSPPQYREDILLRRHNLEEEFLQLSGDLYSVYLSDSESSSSAGSSLDLYSSCSEDEFKLNRVVPEISVNGSFSRVQCSIKREHRNRTNADRSASEYAAEIVNGTSSNYDGLQYKMSISDDTLGQWKPNSHAVSLFQSHYNTNSNCLMSKGDEGIGGIFDNKQNEAVDFQDSFLQESNFLPVSFKELSGVPHIDSRKASLDCSYCKYLVEYFEMEVADPVESEKCEHIICSGCIFYYEGDLMNSKVAILRSSKGILYLLFVEGALVVEETVSRVLSQYRLEDLKSVVFGLGLQSLRVYMSDDASYLFLARNSGKATEILHLFNAADFPVECNTVSLTSWEHTQIMSLERAIGGSLQMGIFFYSIVLFRKIKGEEEAWLARSLFVTDESVLLCAENLRQFGYSINEMDVPYISLDTHCPIENIQQMGIELRDKNCLTLIIGNGSPGAKPSIGGHGLETEGIRDLRTWKLRWDSEQSLLKFVMLLKAIYLGFTSSPLPVKCI